MRNFKRVLSVMLAIVMMVSMLPVSAFAAAGNGSIIVDGVTLTPGQYLKEGSTTPQSDSPTGIGYAHFADSSTLVLSSYSSTSENTIIAENDLVILTAGVNVLSSGNMGCQAGIKVSGNLTIEGMGSLTVKGRIGKNEANSAAISAENITIQGGGTVDARGQHIGMRANGTITVKDGCIVTAQGKQSTTGQGFSVHANKVNVEKGSLVLETDGSDASNRIWNDNISVTGYTHYRTDGGLVEGTYDGVSSIQYLELTTSVPSTGPIVVGGVTLNRGQYLVEGETTALNGTPTADSYAYYDPDEREATLVLHNFMLDVSGPTSYAVATEEDELTIRVNGINALRSDDGMAIRVLRPKTETQSYSSGRLTITGGGTLFVGDFSAGTAIYAASGVTVKGGTTLSVDAPGGTCFQNAPIRIADVGTCLISNGKDGVLPAYNGVLTLPIAYTYKLDRDGELINGADTPFTPNEDIKYVEIQVTEAPAPTHNHDDGTVFDKVWTTTGGNAEAGTYYLDSDITATDTIWLRGETTLCLNGHTLDMGANTLKVLDGTFTVCDCQAERGTVRGKTVSLINLGEQTKLFLQNVNVVNTLTSYSRAVDGNRKTAVHIQKSYIEGYEAILNYGDLDIVNSEIKGTNTGVTNHGTSNIKTCEITAGDYGILLAEGKASISGEKSDISGRYAIRNQGGELKITDGGHFYGSEYGIYLTGGSSLISGGHVEGQYSAITNDKDSSVEISGTAKIKGHQENGLTNYGTAVIGGGTIEGHGVAIGNYATGILYLYGSPSLSVTDADGWIVNTDSAIHATSLDGTSVYEGDKLFVTVNNVKNGQVFVSDVTDENAGKFVLANDRLKCTAYLSGDNLMLHVHEWAEDLSSDENSHWYACTAENCTFTHETEMKYYQFHTYVPDDQNCTTKFYCTECDYVKIPANTHDCEYSVNGNVITEICRNEGCNHRGTATVSAPDNLVYNGESHNIKVFYNNFWGPNLESEAQYYLNGVLTDNTVNAGKYDVVIDLDGVKFELSYIVEKAPLTITAKDNAIVYGDAPAGSGVSYSGFVGSDDKDDLGGELGYDFDYIQFDNVGTDYSITPKGLTSDNYEIKFVPGKLTVTPLEAEIEWPTLSEDDLIYDGSAKNLTAALKNKQNDDNVSPIADLTGDNVNVTEDGFYYTVTGLEGADAGNYKLSSDVKSDVYQIAQADYPVVWLENLIGNHGEPLSTVLLTGGFAWDNPNETIQYGYGHKYAATYTPKDTTNYKVAHGFITVNGADVTAPTGTVTIGENSWNTLWNNITFGLFFKETQTVAVTAVDDESGISVTEYYLAPNEIDRFDEVQWTEFENSFDIDPNNKYVVYIRMTNGAGYETIINSDGVVLDNVVPVISGIENGKDIYGDVTFTVDEDNLASVTVDGKQVDLVDGKYIILADNAEHTVVAADKSGNTVECIFSVYKIYTVIYDMQGHGTAASNESVSYGGKVTKPADPTAIGYIFEGWYTEAACENVWDFESDTVNANITLYAKWSICDHRASSNKPSCSESAICSVCGDQIPALGHGETEIRDAKPASCEEEGYTGDKYCKVCGELLETGTELAMTEHHFKNGKCTDCGVADPDYEEDSVQTGDESGMALWLILFSISGVGIVAITAINRKRRVS